MVTRRSILMTAAAVTALGQEQSKKPLRVGVIAHGKDSDAAIARVKRLNFSNCQVYLDQTDGVAADNLRKALDKYQIEATSLIVTGPGPEVYDFANGPKTIGLVPRESRAARVARMKLGSDFAKRAGIPGIQGHVGFLPEDSSDPLFG